MTFKKAVEDFAKQYNPFNDYWEMQLAWVSYLDYLLVTETITKHQRENWVNPCTPETFKRWNNKWYGLANR